MFFNLFLHKIKVDWEQSKNQPGLAESERLNDILNGRIPRHLLEFNDSSAKTFFSSNLINHLFPTSTTASSSVWHPPSSPVSHSEYFLFPPTEEPKYDTVEPIAKSFPKINNFHVFMFVTAQDDLKPLFTIPESNSHEIVASKASGSKFVRHFVFPCGSIKAPPFRWFYSDEKSLTER